MPYSDPEEQRTYARNYARRKNGELPVTARCLQCGSDFVAWTRSKKLCSDACRETRFNKRAVNRVLKYRKRHPIRVRKFRREEALRYKYGSSLKEKERLYKKQRGRCANSGCRKKFKSVEQANLDHCHLTGKNRALLCSQCNFILGLCHEQTRVLKGLVLYKEKHG